jgi:hypothetical protein
MDLKPIVSEICNQADDFLAGVTRREVARAGIAEWLTIHYLKLPPSDKQAIIGEAMGVLEREEFFDAAAGSEDEDEDFSAADQ